MSHNFQPQVLRFFVRSKTNTPLHILYDTGLIQAGGSFGYGISKCMIDRRPFNIWLYIGTVYNTFAFSKTHILLSNSQATCSISVLLGDFAF
jgi:hypothetical protein